MRRNACLILLAALGLAVLSSGAYAATSVYHFRGNSASATFLASDPSGCVVTWVDVYVYESISRATDGNTSSGAAIEVYASRYDQCQYSYLGEWYGYAALPGDAFSFCGGLQRAQVTKDITLSDYCGNTIPASIDLTWEGIGETYRGSYLNHSTSRYSRSMSRSTGSYRDAQAAGTVLLGTENVAPGSSLWASLYSSQSGYVYHYN